MGLYEFAIPTLMAVKFTSFDGLMVICAVFEHVLDVEGSMGNPGVFRGYPHLYPRLPRTGVQVFMG
jgi:hypothetical protein